MSATSQYNEGYKHMQETLSMLYTQSTGKSFDFTRSTFYSLVVGLAESGCPGIQIHLKDNASREFTNGARCAIDDFEDAVSMYLKDRDAKIIQTVNVIF